MQKPLTNTASEKERAYATLEKATNEELAQVAQHVLGYDPFQMDKLVLPSVTRAKLLSIFKEKIQNDKMQFARNNE